MMAKLQLDGVNSDFREYTLNISDGDRIRIQINGEYVTYMRCVDGTLAYLESDKIETI